MVTLWYTEYTDDGRRERRMVEFSTKEAALRYIENNDVPPGWVIGSDEWDEWE